MRRADRLPDPATVLGLVSSNQDRSVTVPEGVGDAKVVSLKAMKATLMTGTRFVTEAPPDE